MKPSLFITEGLQKGTYIELPNQTPFWIGRDESSQFIISKDDRISNRHCYFLREDSQLRLVDESSNGTYLNGEKIHQSKVSLNNRDVIRIGETRFQVVHVTSTSQARTNIVPPLSAPVPELMGPYQNIEMIGFGATGKVYKSLHQKNQQIVALKIFSNLAELGKSFQERFYREVEFLKKINHPAVIKPYEYGQLQLSDGIRDYIALEYFQGVNLRDYVKANGPIHWKKVIPILTQALCALQYLHSQHIIHRDLKPGNLMYDRVHLKIIDLGLGKCLTFRERCRFHTTLPNSTLGTLHFMPIEQWSDTKTVDQRADIYSLGATVYFLMTGIPPYEECCDLDQIFEALIAQDLIPIEDLLSDLAEIPYNLIKIIKNMMALNASDRYASCQKIIDKLEKLTKTFKNKN